MFEIEAINFNGKMIRTAHYVYTTKGEESGLQNRYAGDAGDFGKIGLLRSLARNEFKVGVNWYLVSDETHNDDGKHTGYLSDLRFTGCDDELH